TAAIDKWYKGQIQSFALIAPHTFSQLDDDKLAPARVTTRAPTPPTSPPKPERLPVAAPPPPLELAPRVVPTSPPEIDRRLTDLTELLHVLIAHAESARGDFRGHSAATARLS